MARQRLGRQTMGKRRWLGALVLPSVVVVLPVMASADLTVDLCGTIANRVENVQSEGVKTSFAVDTVEGRLTPVPHCYIHGTLGGDSRFRIQLPAAWNGKYVLGMGGGWGGDEFSAASSTGTFPRSSPSSTPSSTPATSDRTRRRS